MRLLIVLITIAYLGYSEEPPHIGHIAKTSAHVAKPVEIEASVVDDDRIEEVILYYRKGTESWFSSIPMSLKDGTHSIYSANIPKEDVNFPYIEYYIAAKDVSGNTGYNPPEGKKNPYRIDISKAVWKPIGPYSGVYLWSIVIDPKNPNVIYTMADYGVWKSIDKGKNWKAINGKGVLEGSGVALAIDPNQPSVLYVAPLNEYGKDWNIGVHKSYDGGNSWEKIGLEDIFIYGITVDPKRSNIVYVCTSNRIFHNPAPTGVLYRSEDGGGSVWKEIDVIEGEVDPGFSVVTVDPSSYSTIYAGTWGKGIFKSTDDGDTWTQINEGLKDYPYIPPKGIKINPLNPSILYALALKPLDWQMPDFEPTVLMSEDGGMHWKPINEGLPENFRFWLPHRHGTDLVIDPKEGDLLYLAISGGVYKKEGENRWRDVTKGDINYPFVPKNCATLFNSLAIDPINPENVYLGGGSGFFRSNNCGEYWIQSNEGLQEVYSTALALDPKNAGTIYVGAGETRLFKTEDFGKTWEQLYEGLGNESDMLGIVKAVVDPINPTTVYAWLANMWSHWEDGKGGTMYKSINGGKSWSKANNGLPPQCTRAMVIDMTSPSTLYVALHKAGVYKTVDGGEEWYLINEGIEGININALAIDPSDSNIIYAGSCEGLLQYKQGLYKTTSGGEEGWKFIGLEGNVIYEISVDPKEPNRIYAATLHGLYKSIDGGMNWERIPDKSIDWCFYEVKIDPFISDTIYAVPYWVGEKWGRIHRSSDGGKNWEVLNSGIEQDIFFPADNRKDVLKIDRTFPNRLYAITNGGGAYMCEVTPGPIEHYKLYLPKKVEPNEEFELEIIALDSDCWIVTDYKGTAEIYDGYENFIKEVDGFVNGIAKCDITLNTPGTVTIVVKDKDNEHITGTATLYIKPAPFIKIEKFADKLFVERGGSITYTIYYENRGTITAKDVIIIDVIPEKCKIKDVKCKMEVKTDYWVDGRWQSEFSEKAEKIRWTIPEVAPAESGSVSFVCEVKR
jgi:uncharacterized repeat protein (TIGR01451 family)